MAVLPEIHKKPTTERRESADRNIPVTYPEEEEDDDADEDESTTGKGHDRTRKSRQRRVRKSLEKLTRLSMDKKRRSRQIKSLTAIVPPAITSTVDSSSKVDPVVQTPKRQSLWASLFGNGERFFSMLSSGLADFQLLFNVDIVGVDTFLNLLLSWISTDRQNRVAPSSR